MQADFICLEDKAFKAVIDKVVAYIKAEHGIKEDKWISPKKAIMPASANILGNISFFINLTCTNLQYHGL